MAKRKADKLRDSDDANIEGSAASSVKKTKKTKPSSKRDGDIIKSLNLLDVESFMAQYISAAWLQHWPPPQRTTRAEDEALYSITFKPAHSLSATELDSCFNLIDTTSRTDYAASADGWHPKRKKKEMRDKDMRYLLVQKQNDEQSAHEAEFAGFLSFMLTHDSSPPVPVLYIYEIHLVESARRTGLGAHLMTMADGIASAAAVDKVMLTCFLSNDKARRFYESRGYGRDVCSPEEKKIRNKVVKFDFVIMSKDVSGSRPGRDASSPLRTQPDSGG
jgi:N-alpha-acetyltransferase 40